MPRNGARFGTNQQIAPSMVQFNFCTFSRSAIDPALANHQTTQRLTHARRYVSSNHASVTIYALCESRMRPPPILANADLMTD